MNVPPLSRFVQVPLAVLILAACAQSGDVRTGSAVGSDWTDDAPGFARHIRAADVPAPAMGLDPEGSVAGIATVVPPAAGALPDVPDGFTADVFATGFKQPRTLRTAPNGDIFLAESGTGRVLVFRAGASGTPATPVVFAEDLDRPYGIAFVPATNPRHVYVAAADRVVRYPYNGEARAAGPAEVIIDGIPTERHWTRDLAVSRDGQRLFVSIGSGSNLGVGGMPDMTPAQIQQHEATHGRGAAWGKEENRGVVRVFDADGGNLRNWATGLRNCSGMAMQPGTGNLWCVVNERDHLGPDVTPDFMARIDDGSFHGWPWYHLGGLEDPALAGKRPDLKAHARMPDVLFQAHSSALAVAFYDHAAFPAEYRGDAFVTLHGSHSRPRMTGYKVVRVRMQGGQPTGAYEDFMTGFVLDGSTVWGRPAGVTVGGDGALLVSDDANGIIYRVTRR
ncbi:sorbosone dehydrogenase family protein [Luteimonas yindakuii]|uniref:Sorbosone dehydrogenase family protein n=1 Tax=Luteimonas yindakuii TaxID=2565782 RepID=A0A4Z1R8Q3_9GAMM|nr:PQQ-dependent sugar dehydrogenase [Luteimonas yindakuii]TKS53038.1 sorbosone dehydrogenase family protein [Luteimonas yindakuii]